MSSRATLCRRQGRPAQRREVPPGARPPLPAQTVRVRGHRVLHDQAGVFGSEEAPLGTSREVEGQGSVRAAPVARPSRAAVTRRTGRSSRARVARPDRPRRSHRRALGRTSGCSESGGARRCRVSASTRTTRTALSACGSWREAVGRGMAARTGQRFLVRAPGSFRGRLQLGEAGTDGERYAVVSDGRHFVVFASDSRLARGRWADRGGHARCQGSAARPSGSRPGPGLVSVERPHARRWTSQSAGPRSAPASPGRRTGFPIALLDDDLVAQLFEPVLEQGGQFLTASSQWRAPIPCESTRARQGRQERRPLRRPSTIFEPRPE